MTKLERLLRDANLKRSRGGILTADRYFREVEGCFDGGVCPIKAFGLKSAEEWAASLDEAESKLVYSNGDMIVKAHEKAKGGGPVMQFDCVITSTKRDRDMDILETKGASIDDQCPLLWQHISMQPIGAMNGILKHSDDMLSGRFTIADTELGRDAATLIECGALRISHGFEPTKFKPLKDESEGWHIEEFEIFEVSVVSVPSNTDAVITQFSREKLHDPLVKSWAQKMFDERPTQVSVPETSYMTRNKIRSYSDYASDPGDMPIPTGTECSCQKAAESHNGEPTITELGANADDMPWAKSGIPAGVYSLPQSYEWVRESLSMQLSDICCDHHGWPFVFATYKGYAVICMEGENGHGEMYKASWAMTKGKPTWTSEMVEVDIQVEASVIEKAHELSKVTKPRGNAHTEATAFLCTANIEQVKELGRIADELIAAHEQKQRAEQIERKNSAVMALLS